MSSLTDRERTIRKRMRDDFPHYAVKNLKIRTKAGAIEPLQLNQSQQHLHEAMEQQRQRIGRVRKLVLKSRQVGISTIIGGRFYWRSTHRKGCKVVILTHMDDASDNLFNLVRRFHDNCNVLLKPETGSANAKELTFKRLDSGYKVATAGSKAVGRSDTIQLFHGSEVAFWPNAEDHFAGIMQAIADAPDTEVVLESTANGIGNMFHALWKAAERGQSEFECIFIPWFWHEEYTRALDDRNWSPPTAKATEADTSWAEYQQLYGLTLEQTYWAWLKNRELSAVAGGGADEINWKFRQEYPANADEAFQTSGNSFIPAAHVLKARRGTVAGYGPLILGVDPARGGGDKTGLIDRQGRRLGAHVCKRIDHDDLMKVAGEVQREVKRLLPLGLKKVVIDITGMGSGLYDRLRELLGDLVEGVNFGAGAHDDRKYANRRAEMWDEMRQWFEDAAGVQIPDSDDLQGDLCAPMWGKGATAFRSNGQLLLEDKAHIKERMKFSPDLGDAAAVTFALDMSMAQMHDWDKLEGGIPGSAEAWLAG